jgi:hypothetical protein
MIKQLNESQLCDLITKATKQVLKESFGLDPEVGEDEYQMTQDYVNSPEGEGMSLDNLDGGIEQDYDDFFKPEVNPAEDAFEGEQSDFENTALPDDSDNGLEYNQLLENKNKVDMEEKQDKLLTFITENWDNHANSLIL